MSQQLQLLSNILLMSNLRMVLLNTLKLDEFLMSLLRFDHNTGSKWRTECFPQLTVLNLVILKSLFLRE